MIYAIYLGVGFLAGFVVCGFIACLLLNQQDEAVQLPEQPMYTYSRTWGDDADDMSDWLYDEDDDDERQALRDRLAAALWANRRLKRKARVDNQVAWRLNDLETKIRTWEGE